MNADVRQDLIEWDKKHFIHPTSPIKQQQEQGAAFVFEEGDGIYLKDIDGRQVIDAMSSLWNVNVGHGRTELAEAAKKQMSKLAFSSAFSTFSHEPAIRLAKKVAELAPGDLNAVFFTSGGSEANDSAFKLARHYWKLKGEPNRKKIISRKKAYHGVSVGATSATGIPEFWDMSDLLAPDFLHAEAPYDCELSEAVDSVRKTIEDEGPETIAAFVAEPVQGAGGVIIPPEGYFKEIKKICEAYGILFIADEVITGFGRTGTMFGLEHWGVVPDMMTVAKGISSGYIPLGGVVVSDAIHKVLKDRSTATMFHGFTYSGHPAACAVGLKNIEIIEREGLVNNASKMGEEMLKGCKRIQSELDIVGDVRTIGLLGAVELVADPATNKRFPPSLSVAPKVIAELAKRGMICRSVTYDGTDIIVFAPPLIVDKAQVQTMIKILYDAVSAVQNGLAKS